jgi:predicted amidophosphoribosyltransferase
LVHDTQNWDRCYDCLNIFAEKFSEKIGVFAKTTASFCKNCDHNIGFWEKRQFCRRKLSKIAENCDHNIDSWKNAPN